MKVVTENSMVLTQIIARVVKSRFFCLQGSWELLETKKINVMVHIWFRILFLFFILKRVKVTYFLYVVV